MAVAGLTAASYAGCVLGGPEDPSASCTLLLLLRIWQSQ